MPKTSTQPASVAFRIPADLRKKATEKARRYGVPLALVIKNALNDFIMSDKLIISEIEVLPLTPELQKLSDAAAQKLHASYLRRTTKHTI